MKLEPGVIFAAVLIGIGASLLMDLWNLLMKQAFGIPSLNYCMLGRWITHMRAGTLRHSNIGAAQQRPFECTVGWIAHYTIGVVFAFALLMIVSSDWLAQPTIAPALVVGIATVFFPMFVLQPSIGLGIAASRTPSPVKARLKSFATHTVFGFGLYVCAIALKYTVLGFLISGVKS